jgi:hypothetical protein
MSPATAAGTRLAFPVPTRRSGKWALRRSGLVNPGIVRELNRGGVPRAVTAGLLIVCLSCHRPHLLEALLPRAIRIMLILASARMNSPLMAPLLDTHIGLWSLPDPAGLLRRVVRVLEDRDNRLWLSPGGSCWWPQVLSLFA